MDNDNYAKANGGSKEKLRQYQRQASAGGWVDWYTNKPMSAVEWQHWLVDWRAQWTDQEWTEWQAAKDARWIDYTAPDRKRRRTAMED
jgi:hypothetical protein